MDDESPSPDSPTRRLQSVSSAEDVSEAEQFDADPATVEDPSVPEELLSRHGDGKLSPEVVEETEMMSRDELFRMAKRDRGTHVQDRETIQVEAVEPASESDERPTKPVRLTEGMDPDGETQEMIPLDEKTLQRKVVVGPEAKRPQESLDTTEQLPVEELGAVNDGQLQFPGRIDRELKVSIPPELAKEVGVKPGDLVLVEIQKVKK